MNDKSGGVSTTASFVLKIVEIFREDRRKTPSQYVTSSIDNVTKLAIFYGFLNFAVEKKKFAILVKS